MISPSVLANTKPSRSQAAATVRPPIRLVTEYRVLPVLTTPLGYTFSFWLPVAAGWAMLPLIFWDLFSRYDAAVVVLERFRIVDKRKGH